MYDAKKDGAITLRPQWNLQIPLLKGQPILILPDNDKDTNKINDHTYCFSTPRVVHILHTKVWLTTSVAL